MENASKALIIAGAILLSILIIGLGMAVYNNASSSMGSANLDSSEVKAHNSQFEAYEGKQKGSQVKSLVNAIRSNNKEYADRMIKLNLNLGTTKGSGEVTISKYDAKTSSDDNDYTKISDIKSSTTYFVTFDTGDNGCIAGVEIHIYSDADL